MPTTTSASSTLPLHRIRFYDQTPSPITCLAFPPLPLPLARDPSTHKGKSKETGAGALAQERRGPDELGVLVVARENGDIEIHQWGREHDHAFGNWTCVKVCYMVPWSVSTGRDSHTVMLRLQFRSYRPHSLTRVYHS